MGSRRSSSERSRACTEALRACERREWRAAFEGLRAADRDGQLGPNDLELLAECARWVGRSEHVVEPLERAHAAFVQRGDRRAALRTALALSFAHADLCNVSVAGSWWKRAEELIPAVPESPEHGLYACYRAKNLGRDGDVEGQESAARDALEVALRFGDRNVEALALVEIGHVAAVRGQTAAALDALDRATSLALSGELGVLESGIVFCNAILACRSRGEWGRAQEWTESANRWVDRQGVAYFPGLCRVHRSEVLRVRGRLAEAEEESLEAIRLLKASIPRWEMVACAELGEVRRRRGDLAGAMSAFTRALELGWDPQPGLALVILAQGDAPSALASIERVFRPGQPSFLVEERAGLLGARVRISIAAGALDIAEHAVTELGRLESQNATEWDAAASAQARGELALEKDCFEAAVAELTRARSVWAELDAPYELATCRVMLGRSLELVGDRLGATLEFEAARGTFTRIGAELDREAVAERLTELEAGDEPGSAPARTPGHVSAEFRSEGEVWAVSFEGRTIRLKDTRGLQHLARLLERPGEDHWAVDLAAPAGIPSGAPGAPPPRVAGEAAGGEVLDADARDAYRGRLEDLREELADARAAADAAGEERIRLEMDQLSSELARAIGLGGRSRRTTGVPERARQSVTKAIRGAMRKIAREHPELGRYLEATVRTGTACRFDPDPRRPTRWVVYRPSTTVQALARTTRSERG